MSKPILVQQVESLIEDETDLIANLSNISAVIKMMFDDINWVGFYIYKDDHLVLGPFQGNVACTRLYPQKGVCSYAIETRTTQNIPDVHQFASHVACDSSTNSELVVPLFINNEPFGVLDIDSQSFNRFSSEDQVLFEQIGTAITNYLNKK